MQLVLTSPDVERLTGVTAQQLRDAHDFDLTVDDELHVGLDRLEVVCFIMKYDRTTMGNAPTPGIRFTVVKTYARSALEAPPALPGPSSKSTSGEGPSEDKHLFTPKTVKGMTKIEGVDVPNKSDYPSPPAKRGLDFISAEIDKPKADTLTEAAASDQAFGEYFSTAVGDSPMKMSRDKLKLS